ncbi:uncharacterized protein LOC143302101 isoform X13 [Babylonia areolata]|uniref:uncharacterized protein LOC143302101 isoform X13 n=1 Tax=Babylonia areolata TaxID=304850 RepID=UPI003FD535DA
MVPTVFLMMAALVILPPPSLAAFDNKGKEFILGFMENRQFKTYPLTDVQLFITTFSNTPAMVSVSIPLFNPSFRKDITVTKGEVQTVKVPHSIRGKGIEKSNKGIRIQATEEVSVYGVNLEPHSTDAYVALPVDVLGKEYYALTYENDAELMVIATEDGTDVSITWPKLAGTLPYNGVDYTAGDTLKLTLDKYETFHSLNLDINADFTGAHIVSSKPVAVVSGNVKVTIPKRDLSADHLTEMMMPVDTWGKTFLSTSTPDRSIGDLYRFVASEDATTITLSGFSTKQFIDKAGDFVTLDIPSTTYTKITSDKPIMVAMFAKTFKNDGQFFGDPSMSLIIPEPQYANEYTWATVKTPEGQDFNNKISVIVEKSKMAGLRMDGHPITWYREKGIVGSTKMNLWVRVTPGSHNIFHLDPTVTFMAHASGTAKQNSYAYQAGMNLARINVRCTPTKTVPGDTIDNDCDGTVDEEILNNIDDDGDGLIDEDLAETPNVDGNWGSWGTYGPCSVTCGTGSKSRTRQCDNPAPMGGGENCTGSASDTADCTMAACEVDGNWGSWGPYMECSVTCGDGIKSRTRQCDNPAPTNGGSPCSGSSTDNTECTAGSPCPVDGNWGSWGPYGVCSVTCGEGTKSRTRECDNPAPQHGGNTCYGPGTDSVQCNTAACPIDGNWGSWGPYEPCSVTCGEGSKSRTRQCDSPAPQNGGNICSGSDLNSVQCNIAACPIDGNWGSWGTYGPCSVTCGTGSKSRTRQCDNPAPMGGGENCTGSASDTSDCIMADCEVYPENGVDATAVIASIDGNWGSWGTYGPCSVTCGTGSKSRTRQCDNPAPVGSGENCTGSASDTADCTMAACEVYPENGVDATAVIASIDGNWGSWGTYGPCSVTCGTGSKSRTRQCDNPAPVGSGENCTGSASDTADCTMAACGVDGNWGSWGPYMECSVTCGDGIKSRTRQCDNPAPTNGGSPCSGSSTDNTECTAGSPCPVDGNWGSWGPYGPCSVTCGEGTKSRTRQCDNPAPQHGGDTCYGPGTDIVQCNTAACPIDGNWGSWGPYEPCSVTCGEGSKSRTRQCDNPAPQHGGNTCYGPGTDSVQCNTAACPIDGNWGSWGPYGPCSVTCGEGSKSRTRQCDNPAPQNGGNTCSGPGANIAQCNVAACPIDGNWGSWGPYGPCSVTCGEGTKSRTRQCDNPAPQHGGSMCFGSAAHDTPCTMPMCSSCSGDVRADIIFVLDASGSVGYTNFETLKSFIRDLVSAFEIAPDKIRVGVQKYSTSTNAEIHLNQYYDKTTLEREIMNIRFTGGSTNTGGALEFTRTTMFTTVHGDRSGVPNICVVFTDGRSNSYTYTAREAKKAHDAGIAVLAIGVGLETPLNELSMMASNPDADVFFVPEFSDLKGIERAFHDKACTLEQIAGTGGWGQWGAWSTCTKTCGAGHRLRERECHTPLYTPTGSQCSGHALETRTCSNVSCVGLQCPDSYFRCGSGSIHCVHRNQLCDGDKDCEDGSDEDRYHADCQPVFCGNSAEIFLPVSLTTFFSLLMTAALPAWVTCCDITI